ncbi:hypothetical protein [Synechococcus sp. CS-1328]|uniref:hypothetical protein n=1 Tax=Synechococcus sp. CS-1328 TaxID=2847976 RepID=UPI0037DA2C18
MTPLPPWRPLLRAARQREGRAPSARWLQLASVAADGTPRLRTLVFRGWAEDAALDLLPRARSQFRLRGQHRSMPLRPFRPSWPTTPRCLVTSSCCASGWSRWNCWSSVISRIAAVAGATLAAGRRSGLTPEGAAGPAGVTCAQAPQHRH